MSLFSKNEKKAFFTLLLMFALGSAAIYKIGVKNLWFEKKQSFYTTHSDAADLSVGGLVSLSGIHIGSITNIEVQADNTIKIQFSIVDKIADRIKSDAVVKFTRSSVFGEKYLNLIPGTETATLIPGSKIRGENKTGLSEFITGNSVAGIMDNIENLIATTNKLVSTFDNVNDKEGLKQQFTTIQMINPALKNFLALSDDMIEITEEMKKSKKFIPDLVKNTNTLVHDVNHTLIADGTMKNALNNANTIMEPLAKNQELLIKMIANIQNLSNTLTQNPDYGDKVLTTLTELTTTMRALQETWILADHTKKVKEEAEETKVAH